MEQFFQHSEHSEYSAVCASKTNVLEIPMEMFQRLLRQYPEDLEMYHYLKDKYNSYAVISDLGIKCYACNCLRHQFRNCPFISYQPNREKLITARNFNRRARSEKTYSTVLNR